MSYCVTLEEFSFPLREKMEVFDVEDIVGPEWIIDIQQKGDLFRCELTPIDDDFYMRGDFVEDTVGRIIAARILPDGFRGVVAHLTTDEGPAAIAVDADKGERVHVEYELRGFVYIPGKGHVSLDEWIEFGSPKTKHQTTPTTHTDPAPLP